MYQQLLWVWNRLRDFGRKKIQKECKIEGFSNQSVQEGVCIKNGAIKARCKTEGCENRSVNNGVAMCKTWCCIK